MKPVKRFQSIVFCQVMFQEEVFPDNFINTTLHVIIKGGKGRKEKLTDNRFIHSKSWLPRTAKALCVEDEVTSGGQVINLPNLRPIRPQIRRACIYSEISHNKYRMERKQVKIQSSDSSQLRSKSLDRLA